MVARLRDGTYHGATLSSFSSIALEPEPLVSFSLRLPSRLADALRLESESNSHRIQDVEPNASDLLPHKTSNPPYFSINILSGHPACEPIAQRFSQAQVNHEAALSDPSQWRYIEDSLLPDDATISSEDVGCKGIPVARNGMTTLLCQNVEAIQLSGLINFSSLKQSEDPSRGVMNAQYPMKREEGSMLFIARVVQVIRGEATDVLVYKDRKYLAVE